MKISILGASGPLLSPAAVDAITGLGPAVAVGQNLLNRNPGSTLAAAAGLHPFFRLLHTDIGTRACRACGAALAGVTDDEIVRNSLPLRSPSLNQCRARRIYPHPAMLHVGRTRQHRRRVVQSDVQRVNTIPLQSPSGTA